MPDANQGDNSRPARLWDVYHCARCGSDHKDVVFFEFTRPITDPDGTEWQWWAMCPTTADPILLSIKENVPHDSL